jgi:4-hydroxybenzoate polyprenyltransferase
MTRDETLLGIKNKNRYAGAGMIIGTGIAAAICMTLYATTQNPIYIAYIGLGTALGLIFGHAIDKSPQNPRRGFKTKGERFQLKNF